MTARRFFGSTIKMQGSGVGFLDAYPGAYRASSTKLIYSAYSGPAMKIGFSVNPEIDIYFDSNGDLDEAAIVAYATLYSTSTVNVHTWYDQSGNSRHWNRAGIGDWRIYVSGFKKRNGKNQLFMDGASRALTYTPSYYPNNINAFYLADLDPSETALRNLLSASSNSPAQSHSLVSTSGSTNTTYHRNAGPPTVYKNGVLQSITNRGGVYTLWSSPCIVCEKNLNISSNWSPNNLVLGTGTAGAGVGHNLTDWIEFHEDMDVFKLQGISYAINSSFSTPIY